MKNVEESIARLTRLKDLGVRIAVDDFGTGYSSLSYLQTLPIDTIKIDQSFVATLDGTTADHTILIAIIQLAHGLGMTVVAEGVETTEQHQQLTRLGSDSCQGFYFAHPMPAARVERLIQGDTAANPHLP